MLVTDTKVGPNGDKYNPNQIKIKDVKVLLNFKRWTQVDTSSKITSRTTAQFMERTPLTSKQQFLYVVSSRRHIRVKCDL